MLKTLDSSQGDPDPLSPRGRVTTYATVALPAWNFSLLGLASPRVPTPLNSDVSSSLPARVTPTTTHSPFLSRHVGKVECSTYLRDYRALKLICISFSFIFAVIKIFTCFYCNYFVWHYFGLRKCLYVLLQICWHTVLRAIHSYQ
jgi:hypothetical protein